MARRARHAGRPLGDRDLNLEDGTASASGSAFERALSAWRRRAAEEGHLPSDALDELESHLRDASAEIARGTGLSPSEALLVACERLGDPRDLGPQFRAARGDPAWSRHLSLGLLGFLVTWLGVQLSSAFAYLTGSAAAALVPDGRLAADVRCAAGTLGLLLLLGGIARATRGPPAPERGAHDDGGAPRPRSRITRLQAALGTRRGMRAGCASVLALLVLDCAAQSFGSWWLASRLSPDAFLAFHKRSFLGGGLQMLAIWLGIGAWLTWRARTRVAAARSGGRPAAIAPLEAMLSGYLVVTLALHCVAVAVQLPLALVGSSTPSLAVLAWISVAAGSVALLPAMAGLLCLVRRATADTPTSAPRRERWAGHARTAWQAPLGPLCASLAAGVLRFVSVGPPLSALWSTPATGLDGWAGLLFGVAQVLAFIAAVAWPLLVLTAVARLEHHAPTFLPAD